MIIISLQNLHEISHLAGTVLSPAHGKLEWSQAQALAIYHSQS